MSMTDHATIDTEKQDRLAEISRDDYNKYIQTYKPVEDKLSASINNETLMKEGLDSVSKNADTAGRVMNKSALMRAGRTGGMSAEQRSNYNDRMELGLAATEVGSRNVVRDHIKERDTQNLSSLVDSGFGLRDMGNNTLSTAAQLEANRNSTNLGIAASNTAGRWGAVGTAASLAIMM